MGDDSAIGLPLSFAKGPAVQRRTKLEEDNVGAAPALLVGATSASMLARTASVSATQALDERRL